MSKKISKEMCLLFLSGCIIAVSAFVLSNVFGNPANMGFCIACFIRDIAGAMKFHGAAAVQYMRPEIIGLVLGSFIISLFRKEFKPRGGSSPIVRLVFGAGIMVCALVFLGCPLRMIIRMSGGDLNAYVAFVGFACGIYFGTIFLNKGFSLGRTTRQTNLEGAVAPTTQIILILLLIFVPALFAFSASGPGAKHAPIFVSLFIALIVGGLCQRSRMCCAGGIRDIFLAKDLTLFIAPFVTFVLLLVLNIIGGKFHLSFTGQSIAHSDHVWNFLSMLVVGLGSVMLGGCPLRQLVLAGEGNVDSFFTVIGMFIGSAISHNFGLAGVAGKGATLNGKIAVLFFLIMFVCVGQYYIKRNRQ